SDLLPPPSSVARVPCLPCRSPRSGLPRFVLREIRGQRQIRLPCCESRNKSFRSSSSIWRQYSAQSWRDSLGGRTGGWRLLPTYADAHLCAASFLALCDKPCKLSLSISTGAKGRKSTAARNARTRGMLRQTGESTQALQIAGRIRRLRRS